MSRTDETQNEAGVFDNHSFFLQTKLTQDRMRQISDWIGSLDTEHRKLLDDLLKDEREQEEYKQWGD